jgi:heterodisulfide reductase subunit B
MSYAYFPGCSAKGTAKSYEESLLAVFELLGAELDELPDWNCCGATAFHSVDESKATALGARDLALAEQKSQDEIDLVAPCAGCYRALLKTQRRLAEDRGAAERTNEALATMDLRYEGRTRVRHPLDVLVNDIGVERVAAAVTRPLTGIKIVSYYGCLLVRPDAAFDDQHNPTSMDRLMRAIGAEPVDWPLKTRCCGGSCYCGGPLIGTVPEATLRLSYNLLREAKRRGADAVVTVCSLCQFNLEAFQGKMGRQFGETVDMSVGFLPQVLGLALGLDAKKLGLQRMLRWRLPEPRSLLEKGARA